MQTTYFLNAYHLGWSSWPPIPVHPGTAQYNPVQPSTTQCSPVQPSAAQCSPVQPSTAQYSPVQPSTVHYRPAHQMPIKTSIFFFFLKTSLSCRTVICEIRWKLWIAAAACLNFLLTHNTNLNSGLVMQTMQICLGIFPTFFFALSLQQSIPSNTL